MTAPAKRIRSNGLTCSLLAAARDLDISKNVAYRLAAEGKFPVPVMRIGRQYRVPVASLRQALGLPAVDTDPTSAGAA